MNYWSFLAIKMTKACRVFGAVINAGATTETPNGWWEDNNSLVNTAFRIVQCLIYVKRVR
jgi:hypothetical protein